MPAWRTRTTRSSFLILGLLAGFVPWTARAGEPSPEGTLVAEARTALRRYAVPAQSADRLPAIVDALRELDGARAASALLDLYDGNRRVARKLERRIRVMRQRLAPLPEKPRRLADQVKRDLLDTWLEIHIGQLATVQTMERTLLGGIAALRTEGACRVLAQRLRRGAPAPLVAALCEPLAVSADWGVIPSLLRGLESCRAPACAPIYAALEAITGTRLPRDRATWRAWWKRARKTGGTA